MSFSHKTHDSDSDSDHEEIKGEHYTRGKKHFHDQHSSVHHSHVMINRGDGEEEFNSYPDGLDPEKRKKAYHLHWLFDYRSNKYFKVFHYGHAEHYPRGHPLYERGHWLNDLKKYPVVAGPESRYNPPAVSEASSHYTIPLVYPPINHEAYQLLPELTPPPYNPDYAPLASAPLSSATPPLSQNMRGYTPSFYKNPPKPVQQKKEEPGCCFIFKCC